MKVQEMKELFTLINANITLFKKDPASYVPYGTEMLSDHQLDIFDAEMDKVYRTHTK